MFDRPFRIAFIISLGMHSIALAPLISFEQILPVKSTANNIEVTYFKPVELENVQIRQDLKKLAYSKKDEPQKEALAEKPKEPKKDETLKTSQPPVEKRLPESQDLATDKEIKNKEVATNPKRSIHIQTEAGPESNISYMNYSQLLREKIRQHLFRDYAESMGAGEITVIFILHSSGTLKNLHIIEKDSSPNRTLWDVCIQSIEEASPFKPFPKELDVGEIPFKITISFKPD